MQSEVNEKFVLFVLISIFNYLLNIIDIRILLFGINFQTIGYLERGEYNASLELAFKIAEYFELPLDKVFNPRPFKPLAVELTETPSPKRSYR